MVFQGHIFQGYICTFPSTGIAFLFLKSVNYHILAVCVKSKSMNYHLSCIVNKWNIKTNNNKKTTCLYNICFLTKEKCGEFTRVGILNLPSQWHCQRTEHQQHLVTSCNNTNSAVIRKTTLVSGKLRLKLNLGLNDNSLCGFGK